jgi:hypothetical protein
MSLVLVYHLFQALEITYEKGTPTESIINLFSESLKLKRSLSNLVPSHLLNWSRRTSIGMSLPFFRPVDYSGKRYGSGDLSRGESSPQ